MFVEFVLEEFGLGEIAREAVDNPTVLHVDIFEASFPEHEHLRVADIVATSESFAADFAHDTFVYFCHAAHEIT